MITRRTIAGCFGVLRGLGVLGVLLFASCSGEQVVEPAPEEETGTAIAFSAGLSELQAVTRSDTPLEELGITSFKTWAYKNDGYDDGTGSYTSYQTVMNGYVVRWESNTAATTTTNSRDWEYILTSYPSQTIKFWDFGAKAYRFFAVAPISAAGTFALDDNSTPADQSDDSFKFTMTADATSPETTPYYTRLWFSDNTEKPYGRPVTLEFIQPFAKVRFMFRYANPDAVVKPTLANFDYRPTDPSRSIAQSGTITFSFPIVGTEKKESWTTSGIVKTQTSFTTPYTENEFYSQAECDEYNIANSLSLGDEGYRTTSDIKTPGTYKWYTVLPAVNQGSYTVTVRVDGEERTAVVPAQFMDWQPCYSYTYIFKVNEAGGVELQYVGTGYTDWQGNEAKDHAVYNW